MLFRNKPLTDEQAAHLHGAIDHLRLLAFPDGHPSSEDVWKARSLLVDVCDRHAPDEPDDYLDDDDFLGAW